MVMLATGKRWKGAEASLNNAVISPDLTADFIDYFVFGGMGSKIARQFGISDISLKIDKQTTGIGIKKEVSEKAEISYGIEQSQAKEKEPTVTQKVGGEYKITESVSVEAEKELKQDNETEKTQDKAQTDDKVLIKFKKEF